MTGAITFIGNTLGLSRSDNEGQPGTQDSIGAFTTTNTGSKFGSYPDGTTNQYANNSSSAILTLPAGSTVQYAELIWGGSYINGNVNLSAFINKSITFTTPAGTFSVAPDSATSNEVALGNGASAYVRSANVTSLVQQGGAGTYTTGGVVGTLVINNDSTANHAGWTLGVIYQNPSLPFRNMSLRAGAVLVQSTSAPVSTTLTGFATPVSGSLGGRALFSAQEGDANRTGDQALFGPTSASQSALSGPNNFANNFFASQINNDAGQLNTTGTFGSRNQTNGAPGSNIVGGRQGWDITNVDISARLANNQSTAVLTLTTSGDAYLVNANAIQIDINAPKISVAKSANVTGAIIGDTVTYTVTVSNTGTANAASVVLSDALPSGSTFVAGSVTVGGVSRPTYDIAAGVPLGSLALNTSVTVTYRAAVTSLPSTAQLANTANAAFTFQSVAGGSIISGVIPSNTVTLPVYAANISILKSASTSNGSVGSTVTYTLQVANTGSIGATVTLTDNIPAGTSYVPESFRVNGTAVPGANPAAGVNIGLIAAGGSSTVTFSVLIESLPSPPRLLNQGTAAYTFQPPDGRTISGSAASNTVSLPVRLPSVSAVKSTSASAVTVGDTLTYAIEVTNTGVESVTNVVVTDPVPAGTAFVPGSVTAGGVALPSATPSGGIAAGAVAPGRSVTVSFQVNVVSLPASAQLSNQASVSYGSGTFTGTSLSNTVTTPVYQPIITIGKTVDTANATVGDTLTYMLTVRNQGNLAAQVTVSDPIPPGTVLVPGSVTVNGTASPSANPATGIPAGSVAPGGTAVVTFQFLLQSLPSPPRLINQATASFTYQSPDGRTLTGSTLSNTVDIPASAPNVSVSKAVNAAAAAVDDVLIYTLVVTNNGIEAVNNVVLFDSAPAGSAFVPGSVSVGGASRTGADPAAGIQLSSLAAGASVTVAFSIRVASIPNPPLLSNRASVSFSSGAFSGSVTSNDAVTAVEQPVIAVAKSANRSIAIVGDTVVYTLNVTNTGSAAAQATLTDNIPSGTSFIANSVIVNGKPVPGVDPVSGIPVGTIPVGGTAAVTFEVTVQALPNPQQLVNQAAATYTYTLSGGRQLSRTVISNTVTIPVTAPNVSVAISSNKSSVVQGDTITYTAVIANQGLTSVSSVVFTSPPEETAAFVPGSAALNGSPLPLASPATGIPIGPLAPGASATVTYEVRIRMPTINPISNQSSVSFTSGTFSGTSTSNAVVTPVVQPDISLVKTADTNNATLGDTVSYTVVISNTGNLQANVTLNDTIPAGATFVPNSVIIGTSQQPGADPAAGINVGTVAAGASVAVKFSVVLTSLPSPQQTSNFASAAFTFTTPDGRTLTRSAASNIVTFPVSAPNVSVQKSVSSTAVTVGDTVTFSTVITNSGIEAVTNVVFTDSLPVGTVFVPGSVTVTGIPSFQTPPDPSAGVPIGNIAAGASVTVAFQAQVTALPTAAQLNNQASVGFTSGAFSGTALSNIVTAPVYEPIIAVVKSANIANATVGDTIAYTLTITNSGNYPGTVTVTDTIPAGTTFQPNSVYVGDTPIPGGDPASGIFVGPVTAGASVPVTFSVVVTSLPDPQQLNNFANAAITFTLPDSRTINRAVASNLLTIPVSAPNVTVTKSANVSDAVVGDIITYTVGITNNGIEAVTNVVFSDPIPPGEAFIPGSVVITGAPQTLAPPNPVSGIPLGSIAPGETVTVAFNVRVTALPDPAQLGNQASVSFSSGAFSGVTFSNEVTTPVYQPIITVAKTAGAAITTVGNTLVYTLTVTNTGNYPANVTLTDTIPAGTSFVPNSVVVNGAPLAGTDPSTGIPAGVVAAGGRLTATFAVVINTLPTPQQLSNQATASFSFTPPDGRTLTGSVASNVVRIPVSAPNVSVQKTAAATDAVVGDTITFTILVTNNGTDPVNNVVFRDPIPANTVFVPGTVTIGGTPAAGADPSDGIPLGTIAPGGRVTVTFGAAVAALPPSGSISNQSSVSFTSGSFSGAAFSNPVTVPVYQPIIAIVKSANIANATVGDTITYTLTVTNSGNLPANVTLSEPIPTGAAFVANSVIIDNVQRPDIDPSAGINIGTVRAGDAVTVRVTLEVTVDSLPSPQQLTNQATGTFTFTPPDGRTLTGSAASNAVTIPVSAPNISVVKTSDVTDAVVGDTITYTVVVTNNGIEAVNHVVLTDPIPNGTRFIPGSVTVNGSSRTDVDPGTGIPLGSLGVGVSATVNFEVLVV